MNTHRKMDMLAAVEMRQKRRAGRSARQLAAEYEVDVSHVHSVIRGDAYSTQILVPMDDETYLSLHRAANKSRKTIPEYAARILQEAVK